MAVSTPRHPGQHAAGAHGVPRCDAGALPVLPARRVACAHPRAHAALHPAAGPAVLHRRYRRNHCVAAGASKGPSKGVGWVESPREQRAFTLAASLLTEFVLTGACSHYVSMLSTMLLMLRSGAGQSLQSAWRSNTGPLDSQGVCSGRRCCVRRCLPSLRRMLRLRSGSRSKQWQMQWPRWVGGWV